MLKITMLKITTGRVAVGVGVIATAAAWLIAPAPQSLADRVVGDRALAADVREAAGEPKGYDRIAVAMIENGQVRYAGLGDGVSERTPFEMGSTTKVLTGMLFATLIADGTVTADDTLAATMPDVDYTDPDAGSITLAQLSSHRAGLPGIPADLAGSGALAAVRGGNPYAGQDVDALRASLAKAGVGRPGSFTYSNFGAAVLGQALAAKVGTPYPRLLRDRVLAPLGMGSTVLRGPDDPVPDGAPAGQTATGRSSAPWLGEGYQPAGVGTWSTVEDLAKLVRGVLDRSAPGADAAEPRFDTDRDRVRIGYHWFTTTTDEQTRTWHNGLTGGYGAYIGFDRAAGRGVVVLGNTDQHVDPIGIRLLGGNANDSATGSLLPIGLTLLLLVLYPIMIFFAIRRAAPGTSWRPVDRLMIVTTLAWAWATLLLAHRIGSWLTINPILWVVAVGASAAGGFLLIRRWSDLPTVTARLPVLRWIWVVASAGLALLLAATVITLS